jgi:mRNA-degrading endonuclease RelE of RelBE toxin-antitoxin system
MEVRVSEKAKKDLEAMPKILRGSFIAHLEKIQEIPPRKHMKYGIPCHVEKVTKQARLIYQIDADKLFILLCFSSHKEYERWYRSYR